MAVSPLHIPGKILMRGFSIPNSKYYYSVVKILMDKYQGIINAFGLEQLNELQQRILFTLEAGVDLYIAGPELDDIRLACLIPVLEHVLVQLLEQQKREAAPSTIIICESTSKGLWLTSLIEDILDLLHPLTSSSGPKVTFIDNVHSEAMLASVTQPMDILILTASSLQEIQSLGCKTAVLNTFGLKYYRTRYIIIEELGMKEFYSEKDIIQFFNGTADKTTMQTVLKKLPSNAQLVFLGTAWHNEYIGSVRQTLSRRGRKQSVMIFGSTQHALQYSHSITWQVDHVDNDNTKLNLLVEICKNMLLEKRSVLVACSSSDKAKTVSKYISEIGGICNSVITCEHNATSGVFRKNRDWLGSVFVIADNAWQDTEVYNAWQDFETCNVSCLIHFDIDHTPANGKMLVENEEPFCPERFACMWKRMERDWRSSVEPPGLTHLLVSGEEPNFLALHKFLQTINIPLPHSLKDIAKQKLQKQISSKPLCTNFKCFAFCNTIDCPDRHEISQDDLDIQPDVPNYGELEFKVIQSISPSLYVVKLVNHYVLDENTGKRICAKAYKKEARERILQMMDYYAIERNRICPLTVGIGELYSIPFNQQEVRNRSPKPTMYLRAKLTGFVYEHGTYNNNESGADYIEVFCVDFGMTMTIPLTHLMILCKQFREWKPFCVQMVLSNLLYSNDAKEYYSDALVATKLLTEGKVWHGKILLSLRDTVWINPMVQYENDPVTGHLTLKHNVQVELVDGKYATFEHNHKHMMMVLDYIRKQDPNYPTIEHEMNCLPTLAQHNKNFHKKGDLIKWADLPLTGVDHDHHKGLTPVPFTIQLWIDPWEIYGAVCDEESEILEQLEQELSREMERMTEISKMKIFGKHVELLEVGSVVAVKISQENRWQRALIMKKSQGDETAYNNMLDVFLVDYGSLAFNLQEFEQVVPIRKVYVDALPFQAVCLQLAHIQPLNAETDWRERDVEQFSFVIGDIRKTMNVIAFTKFESTGRPCNCYTAMAYRKLKVDTGYLFEEMGMELVLKECAETTMDFQRVCSVAELITNADDENLNDLLASDSESGSSSCETADFALVDDDSDDEDDANSETSLGRWKRFCDVEVEEGEYVAVAQEESELFSNETNTVEKIRGNSQVNREMNEILQGTFGKVCQNLSGLKKSKADLEDQHSGFPKFQEDDKEEFYDAMTGEVDEIIECENFSELDENEQSVLSLLRHWFMKTL